MDTSTSRAETGSLVTLLASSFRTAHAWGHRIAVLLLRPQRRRRARARSTSKIGRHRAPATPAILRPLPPFHYRTRPTNRHERQPGARLRQPARSTFSYHLLSASTRLRRVRPRHDRAYLVRRIRLVDCELLALQHASRLALCFHARSFLRVDR